VSPSFYTIGDQPVTVSTARSRFAALALASAVIIVPGASAQASQSKTQAGPAYTAADVKFMQGMIGHHAQALVMAAMAPTHGASAQVSLFCKKVIISQRDEIVFMQTWLKDRGQTVPDVNDPHAHMDMSMNMDMGDHAMLMPGMLTPEQMKQLDQARDTTFDRLFLTFMIQHHEGALKMVADLFDSPGAGQTAEIFGYATGVDTDQRAEIERMEGMLSTLQRRTPQ
jgi:uncharacterized protein (DUF305 family)